MKKILVATIIFFGFANAFAVSSLSGMVDYHFSSNVGKSGKASSATQAEETQVSSTDDNESLALDKTTEVGQENAKYKDCLEQKVFGDGTWSTYCQPIKKPEKCSEDDWNKLASLAILNC